ncbi:MAG: response regulator [Candidatus Heimdallarchaeota archaeon]|nr:response regulator [Candidatus Heimdallarchaeota archaeon]
MKIYDFVYIDDCEPDYLIFLEVLEELNFKGNVKRLVDGELGHEFLLQLKQAEKKPKLIILDLNMPILHGMDLLKIIKMDEFLRTIPVIIMSSSEYEKDIQNSYFNYANSYIVKPDDYDSLLKTMECIINYWFKIVKL